MKTKEKSLLKIPIILILMICMIIFVQFICAKYISIINGRAEAQVAQFNFTVTGKSYSEENGIIFATTRKDSNSKVEQDMLAPGTYGEIPININVSGTQAFVEYTISIALENKPENLKFYYDEEKTLEIDVNQIDYYNSEFSRKGFLSFADNDLVRTEYMYWDWPLETGDTEDDINKNDKKDSAWMDTIMTMSIGVKGMQVAEKPMYYAANYGDIVNYTSNGQTIRGVVVNKIADVVEIMPVITAEDNPEDESMIGKAITLGNVRLGYKEGTTNIEQKRLESITSYNNVVKKLNKAAQNGLKQKYGYELMARALKIEDVNRLVNYIPTERWMNDLEYAEQPTGDNIQRFIVDSLTKVTTSDGETINAIEIDGIKEGDTITIGNIYYGKKIESVIVKCKKGASTNAFYNYNVSNYPLLSYYFTDNGSWLASCDIYIGSDYCHYGIRRIIGNNEINHYRLYDSNGNAYSMSLPIIPVFSILSNVKVYYDKENDEWNAN